MHGQEAGPQDIDLVYLCRRDDTHGPRQCVTLDDGAQLLSLAVGELLRVVELLVVIVGRQDDRCGIHTTCQTTAPSFVASSLYKALIEMTLQHFWE